MLTTSACAAPLWRRIPHGEHVSRLRAADKVMTALRTLKGAVLCVTLGKGHPGEERGLRGKKHEFLRKCLRSP